MDLYFISHGSRVKMALEKATKLDRDNSIVVGNYPPPCMYDVSSVKLGYVYLDGVASHVYTR